MVHQQYMLVSNMTVLENIALGYTRAWSSMGLDLDMIRARIGEVSRKYGLAVAPDAFVWRLSVGEQQRVELVKTLCLGARFLILDEPTSALTPRETDELILLLRRMTGELSIIFISHKLHEGRISPTRSSFCAGERWSSKVARPIILRTISQSS